MKNKSRPIVAERMLKRWITFLMIAAFLISSARLPVLAQQTPPYKDPKLSIDARVRDLLARMTIEEKAAQMMCLWDERPIDKSRVAKELMPYGGDFSPELAKLRMPYGIGQFASQREEHDPRGSAEFNNAVQKWLVENTRLGIPAVSHAEILHGNMGRGSTVFPVPIALASSWDPVLMTKVFTVGARQTRIRGSQHVLGPNMDLARDPRWGRSEETYGEDPYLASQMLISVVNALQGNATYANPKIDDMHVIATGKHFAG